MLEVNANFAERVVVHGGNLPWQASPIPGVERRMLDRLGDEVARATSIVRYAPQSRFAPHVHTGGEEFFVLEGVFQDEHGDFPAGTYVRNPPCSRHTPGSRPGCIIFVKLWQFDMSDRQPVSIDTNKMAFTPDPTRSGVEVMALFQDTHECVQLERWCAHSRIDLPAPQGLELLVLEGSFSEGGENFVALSWLRLPKGAHTKALGGKNGMRAWIKRGHLATIPAPPVLP